VNQIRKRMTYANVMSTLAVFLLLGGASALAAGQLGKNSVGPKQLKKNAVTAAKVKNGAITTAKLANGAVITAKLADGSVLTGKIANGAVTSAQLGASAVTAGKLADGAVTTGKLANGAVTTAKLGDKAVSAGKIADKAIGFAQADLTFVNKQVNVAAGDLGSAVAVCPAGTTVLAGGGGFPGVKGSEGVMVSSEPAGGGWDAEAYSIAGTHTLVATAYCLRNP
jgi:hypothetical protein